MALRRKINRYQAAPIYMEREMGHMHICELVNLCGFDELWLSLELDFHEKPFWRDKYRALYAHLNSACALPGRDALMLTSMPMAHLTDGGGVLCDWDSGAYMVGEDLYCALGITPLDLTAEVGETPDERPAHALARYLYEILHWGDKATYSAKNARRGT